MTSLHSKFDQRRNGSLEWLDCLDVMLDQRRYGSLEFLASLDWMASLKWRLDFMISTDLSDSLDLMPE